MPARTVEPRSKYAVALPLPPSTNNLFATVRVGRRVKSKAYRDWLEEVAPLILELKPPVSFPTSIRVCVIGKVRADRDLDNMLKPVGDALVAAGILPGDSVRYVAGWEIVIVNTTNSAESEPSALVSFARPEWANA